MNPRSSRLVTAALAAALAAPASASASASQPPDCPLYAQGPALEHSIPGTHLLARDPYGGIIARNRLFFSFGVVGAKAELTTVARAEWALDGVTKRVDDRAPFQWKALSHSSKNMPAGEHVLRVTVVGMDGSVHQVEFPISATDCQPATFMATAPGPKRGAAHFSFGSAFESTGRPLDALSVTATSNLRASLPRAARGARAGTLRLTTSGSPARTYTLRVRRSGATLLRRGMLHVVLHPGRARMLDVTGLPGGTQNVELSLSRRLVSLRSPCSPYRATGTLRAGSQDARVTSGGSYVC